MYNDGMLGKKDLFLVLCLLQTAPLRAMEIDSNVPSEQVRQFNSEALASLGLAITPEVFALSPGISLSGPVHVSAFHPRLLEALNLPLASGLRQVHARSLGGPSRAEPPEPLRTVDTLRQTAIPGQAGPAIDGGRPRLAVVQSMPKSNVVALRGDYASWITAKGGREPRVDARFFASAVHLDFSELRTAASAEGRREWEDSDPLLGVVGVDDYGRIYLKDMEQGTSLVIPPDKPLHPLPLVLDAVGPDGKGYCYHHEQRVMQVLGNDGRPLQAIPLGIDLAFSAIAAMTVDWFGGMTIEPIFAFSQSAVLRDRRRLLTFTENGVLRATIPLKDGSSWATDSRGDVFIFEEEQRGVFAALEYPAGERESSRRVVLDPHHSLGPKEHLSFSIDRQGRFVTVSSNGSFWLFSSDGKNLTHGELPKGSFRAPPMFDFREGIFFYDDAARVYRLQQRRDLND